MTSALELFHNRRSRFGRGTTGGELQLDSPGISHHHGNLRRHQHHYSHNFNSTRRDGCDPPRRSSHLRHPTSRLSRLEHESVQSDQGGIQSPSANIINSDDFRSIRSTPWSTGFDRLPGAVLLARERLLERLRGVSASAHRQSSRASPIIRQNEVSYGVNSSSIELDNNHETATDWLDELISDSMSQVSRLLPSQVTTKNPPGLTQEALDCLHVEVFNVTEIEMSCQSECSICLESFVAGEELICLPCGHRFHSCCLIPWVRNCGICPNCRTSITVTSL